MAKEEDGYKKYEKKIQDKMDFSDKYLQTIKDDHNLILINARKSIDYELKDDNREKFGDDLADEFEKYMIKFHHQKEDVDKESPMFQSNMRKQLGVTRKELKRIIENTKRPEDVYNRIEQEIRGAQSRFHQEHYMNIANDYIDISKPETLEHIIKYLKLEDKIDGFDVDLAKRQPDKLKELFSWYNLDGKTLNPARVPIEMLKKAKPKKKD